MALPVEWQEQEEGFFVSAQIFQVEKILNRRMTKRGFEYLVKWETFGNEYNSWEPIENLIGIDAVKEYEAKLILAPKPRNRHRQQNTKRKQKYSSTIPQINTQKTTLKDFEDFLSVAEGPQIKVFNNIDDEGIPPGFLYVNDNIYGQDVPSFNLENLNDCECTDCSLQNCRCKINNPFGSAYDEKGLLALQHGAIYECTVNCRCSAQCTNRIVQRGRKVALDIKRFPDGKGWGVVAREKIPSGVFVSQYAGEIITSKEATKRSKYIVSEESFYFFDLDYNYQQGADCEYTIDASRYGNIAHFINHSCNPNLRVVSVFINNCDPRIHSVAFFASRDIEAGEEICFDYTGFDGSSPENGSISLHNKRRLVECKCYSANCRKYIFT